MPLPLSLIPEFLPTPKRSQRSAQGVDTIAEPLADTALVVEVSPPEPEVEPSTPAPPEPEAEPSTPAPPEPEAEPAVDADPPEPEAEPAVDDDPPEPEAEPAVDDDGEHLTVVLSATELERTKTLRELRQMCEEAKKPSTGKKSELARRLTSE